MNHQPLIDPCLDGIRPHACLKHIPLWPDNGPRMMALRTELQTTGLCPPIQMTAKHEIVDADSRERWRAAKMLQLPGIPVAIVAAEQVASACLGTLIHRRHLTKSALAYLAYPLIRTAWEEASARRLENLKKSNVLPIPTASESRMSIPQLAENLGISVDLLELAKWVHDCFNRDAAFKAQMEPRILAEPIGGEHEQHRPVGLGSVRAGYEGKKNEDKARQERQLDLFVGDHLNSLANRISSVADVARVSSGVGKWLDKIEDVEQIERLEKLGQVLVSEAKARLKHIKVAA